MQLSVGFDRAGTFGVQGLVNRATGQPWDITPGADVSLTAGSEKIIFSTRSSGLIFLGASARATDTGVLLVFTFEHRGLRLRFSRTYAAYPDAAVIETWTRIEAEEGSQPTELSNLIGWQMTMPADAVKWVGGLRSYAAPGELEPFELSESELDPNSSWELGSDRRSTENYLPFVSVDDGENAFYGGIMWSGAWRMTCERRDDRLRITAWFPETPAVALSRPIEIPHTFFGTTTHGAGNEAAAIRHFFVNGLRGGHLFSPLVTYNTWFVYGTTITEDVLMAEIDRAAALGIELFVVDAGWYAGAGLDDISDFEAGLGRLTADPDRFPSSLASLAGYTHDRGMKFGLWVEPERVALDVLAEVGVREGWLATRNGLYEFDKVGQVCLSGAAARSWLVERLSTLIETVGPDYLKWDNNGWVNCNRSGHGHGPNDGNFAHVDGLYQVLREIRARFPDLLIENVSGGGNRLDFGMLALTDAGWMDDRSYPSSHVRHNLEGLTAALPPAYLLSFVIAGSGEEIDMGNDLWNIMRSRMPGILGLTFRAESLGDDTLLTLAGEIQRYKEYRDLLTQASATLLSRQAPVFDGWDVLQEVADDGLSAVVFAFKSDPADGRLLVRPRGLRSDVVYQVRSADVGFLGTATGESLMADGIELDHQPLSSLAHILVLTAAPESATSRNRR
jgi:alpha-galactosidase